MAVNSSPFSHLNPNAPLFVPDAFLQAEDFSAEWWHLVHTCPAFRDYWLRERFDCADDAEMITIQDLEELNAVDDLLDDLQAELEEMEQDENGVPSSQTPLVQQI